MSEPLTAAGLREKLENNVAEAVESGLWDWGGWCDTLDLLLASTAARAVDEALSVERVAEALHAVRYPNDPETCSACLTTAAALVAHLRGPRPEGEG